MTRHCSRGWRLVSLVAVLVLTVFRPADAEIVLAVAEPATNGLVVGEGGPLVFAPATDNPVMVSTDGDEASAALRQAGTQMILSLTVTNDSTQGGLLASTGQGPDEPFFGGIPIQILGTAGEPEGTPVSLTFYPSGAFPPTSANVTVTSIVGLNTALDPTQTTTLGGFKVGDTFTYWSALSGGGGSYDINFIWIVSVQPDTEPLLLGEDVCPALLTALARTLASEQCAAK